jgi:hypothetical protein
LNSILFLRANTKIEANCQSGTTMLRIPSLLPAIQHIFRVFDTSKQTPTPKPVKKSVCQIAPAPPNPIPVEKK